MRIAQLASNEESVPPRGYGGSELVVSLLTEELVARGHKVTLFATGGSETAAELVSEVDRPLRATSEPARRWAAFDIRQLLQLSKRVGQFDIIHNHMGWQALPYLANFDCPVVTTNHNPIKAYNQPVYLQYKHLPYVAISQSYRAQNLPHDLNYVDTVYNGIDVGSFVVKPQSDRSYLLFIGRLCQDKGTEQAIKIAQALNLPIILAGKVDAADKEYFERRVKPYLDHDNVKFVGEVGLQEKVALYSGAIATVYPIDFEEPFGLVLVESLAAATPVLALQRGAVNEILTDGQTGIIAKTPEQLIQRFSEISKISGAACRARVEALFSKNKMVDAYETVYRRLIGGGFERSA